MVMDVHLRDLRYFVAVAEHLHFTRAAEALHVSQPALSKQVRVLETQLRTPLFERDRQQVRLTPGGAALLPHARTVLAAWADAVAEATATFVVGMSTGVGRGLMPAIRAAFPDARLQLRQVPWDDPTGGVGGRQTDVAFVWWPVPHLSRYGWQHVATERRLLAVPASHRFAGRTSIDIADVLDEPFLALPAAAGELRDHWLAAESRGGHPVTIGGEISSAEAAAEAVAAGLGVCLVAEGNVPLVSRDGVVCLPITGVPPSRLILLWRRDDRRPLLEAFRAAVAASAR